MPGRWSLRERGIGHITPTPQRGPQHAPWLTNCGIPLLKTLDNHVHPVLDVVMGAHSGSCSNIECYYYCIVCKGTDMLQLSSRSMQPD